jgi:sarcosine oxidase delta subunit
MSTKINPWGYLGCPYTENRYEHEYKMGGQYDERNLEGDHCGVV